MRKTVNIDGRDVKLVSHGATPLLYKMEFGSDFFGDLIKMVKSLNGDSAGGAFNIEDLTYEDLDHLDLTVVYQMVYVLAKSGNKEIDEMYDWLSEFDEFPVFDFLPEIMEMLQKLLTRKKK